MNVLNPRLTAFADKVGTQLRTINARLDSISAASAGVSSFNGRSGTVLLLAADVTGALGFTPLSASANAITASKLLTARTINGVSFDGSANITIAGSAYSVVTKTAAYTETLTGGEQLALCNLSAGFIVTLPPAAANTAKLTYKKVASAGQITIARAGSDTIDGAASAVLNNQNEAITLFSDGVANWEIC